MFHKLAFKKGTFQFHSHQFLIVLKLFQTLVPCEKSIFMNIIHRYLISSITHMHAIIFDKYIFKLGD